MWVRAAVVGHVEWVEFLRVDHVPTAGEIVEATESWQEPAGGGAAAAVQLLKLCGDAVFYTALGDDELGHRAHAALTTWGLRVEAAFRDDVTRRAITHVDTQGERTITVVGERLAPHARDGLAWDGLAGTDAVYLTDGDVGALRHARRARVLVATARILPLLAEAKLHVDALVGSRRDPAEEYLEGALDPPPEVVVRTSGAGGGTVAVRGEATRSFSAPPLPGPIVDSYGAGDSFAAGLTYALARDLPPLDAARFAARCGAAVLTGRGPYEAQLRDPGG
ncbi:MAG: ribokinase [Actinobacteria bacterium]|nr:ribokinase [Actinomycetota bacterium]